MEYIELYKILGRMGFYKKISLDNSDRENYSLCIGNILISVGYTYY